MGYWQKMIKNPWVPTPSESICLLINTVHLLSASTMWANMLTPCFSLMKNSVRFSTGIHEIDFILWLSFTDDNQKYQVKDKT